MGVVLLVFARYVSRHVPQVAPERIRG